MNQVRLTGFIVDEIDMRKHSDGLETASVSLQFNHACGPVLLCALGGNTHVLAQFKPGDPVIVSGRLTVNRRNGKPSVLVDDVRYANEHRERDQRRALARFQEVAGQKARM